MAAHPPRGGRSGWQIFRSAGALLHGLVQVAAAFKAPLLECVFVFVLWIWVKATLPEDR